MTRPSLARSGKGAPIGAFRSHAIASGGTTAPPWYASSSSTTARYAQRPIGTGQIDGVARQRGHTLVIMNGPRTTTTTGRGGWRSESPPNMRARFARAVDTRTRAVV
ncbi:MAG TPA: hypothetical protein VGI72_08645 [Gaiellales bacterium]